MSRPRHSPALFALALSSALLLHACAKDDPTEPPAGAVTGTVSGAVTLAGSGLTGLTVSVSGPESKSTTTGTPGIYVFHDPAKGSYSVTVASAATLTAEASAVDTGSALGNVLRPRRPS